MSDDIIDRLELEQTRSGMWADTCILLEEAAQEIRKLRDSRDFWKDAANANLDYFNTAQARAERAEREKAEAVAAEREACWSIAHEMENSQQLSKIEQYRAGFIAAAIRARNGQ